MTRRHSPLGGILCLALLLAPPVVGQENGQEDAVAKEGFRFGFHAAFSEIGLMEVSDYGLGVGSVTQVGAIADDGDGIVRLNEAARSGRRDLGLDKVDSDLSLRFEVGFTWAREGDEDPHRNRAVLRVWQYDPSEESFSATSFASATLANGDDLRVGGIVPLLGSGEQVIAQGENLPYAFRGNASLEAGVYDLLWTHRLRRLSERWAGWEFEWSAGLRYLDFKTEAAALFTTDIPAAVLPPAAGADAESDESVRFTSETQGFGPIVGARLGYRFGQERKFGIYGALEVSGLRADTDWTLQSVQSTRDAIFTVPDLELADVRSEESDRTVTTIEIDLGLSYRFSEMWEVRGGYRHTNMEDVWAYSTALDPNQPNVAALRTELESAEIQGPYVGISFDF